MISINIEKAKYIAHAKRREARAEEFKPLDDIIMKQIPGSDAVAAEVARQVVREKYHALQLIIDEAVNIEQLKAAMPK